MAAFASFGAQFLTRPYAFSGISLDTYGTHTGLIFRMVRSIQRQFSENICSEDDLRSRIFGTFVVIYISCLPASPRIFEHPKNGIIAHF